eukprot:CAMPEP_0113675850 /NCGR_PEP_ID=MMETSP0038_2-20120614/8274_1 /TAXON_ID=2898 /ORGANISM="Cryptomonas paramecium" /LENGTH=122 /DNA_ID=CAMNT_0000592729 /DNA_START=210 /DNA_END=576 /DNA_ORIENTATION=+ /assembly_acc=CAM_ASM_000170
MYDAIHSRAPTAKTSVTCAHRATSGGGHTINGGAGRAPLQDAEVGDENVRSSADDDAVFLAASELPCLDESKALIDSAPKLNQPLKGLSGTIDVPVSVHQVDGQGLVARHDQFVWVQGRGTK